MSTIQQIVAVANKHGWNGVENSKILHVFLDGALTEWRELNHLFELRHKADMRAIERWRKAHPGNELVQPDHADLCVWLMDQLDASESDDEPTPLSLAVGKMFAGKPEVMDRFNALSDQEAAEQLRKAKG